MNDAIIYFAQSALILAIFYLIYSWWLSKETFFAANRYFLISGLIMAVLLPLHKISYPVIVVAGNAPEILSVPLTSMSANQIPEIETATPWMRAIPWITGVYYFITAILLLHLLVQTTRFWWAVKKSDKTHLKGIPIVDSEDHAVPFSFFNYIIMDTTHFNHDEKKHVFAHERVHIDQMHWIDLLLASIAVAVFWFNPVIWWYRKTIKQNHEFLADAGAILTDHQSGAYMSILLKEYLGDPGIQLSHSYNTGTHKKRFIMIQKKKSKNIRQWIMLLVLPAIAGIMTAFASPEYIQSEKDINEASISTDYPSVAMTEQRTIKGKVFNKETGEGVSGANVVIQNTTTGTVTDRNGEFALRISPEQTAIVISYVGYHSETIPITTEDYFEVLLQEKTYVIKPDTTKMLPESSDPLVWGDEVYRVVEEMPSPALGNINNLFAEQINPEAWRVFNATHETGTVFVEYVITATGNVAKARVVKSKNEKLNAHAIGIIEKTKWNPGVQRGVKVAVRAVTPVNFPPAKDEP